MAIKLSKMTMGYAYGYQLLGNLLYKNDKKLTDELIEKYDYALESNVYSFIWKGLSKKDKQILTVIAEGNTEVSKIIAAADINNSTLQVYKSRLHKAGLVDVTTRGMITFALPRLREYILLQKEFDD